jgi:YVTN family beta-propeller protein
MAITKDGARCYVTNSNDDTVSTIDLAEGRVLNTFSVRPAQDIGYGQMPVSCALSADEKRLFVTCGGGNSVAVIDLPGAPKVAGYLPAGWFPLAVARVGSGLAVASSKGIGARPDNPARGYGVHASVGMVQVIPEAEIYKLAAHTKQVAMNNAWSAGKGEARADRKPVPIPERVGEPSVFRHVVYIIKENHTYDLDLGDMQEGNGDPKLCLFPEEVTPNAHALAREFILLDNAYTSGTNSADGHQWVASSIANGYMEQNYNAHERSYPYDGGDPLSTSPTGYLWTQAAKAGKSVRVYGEFVDKPKVIDPSTGRAPNWKQLWDDYKSGANKMQISAHTSQAALRPHMHPTFIGFPSIVSDQWRADQYIAELKEFEAKGSMPDLSIMLLPNNHTSGTRAGMPTPRAAVADNDLALGRIVDAISKSRFWKETLILVVEDDSQLAFDHIDGHRMPVQAISAYTRRKSVNHEPYNHTSFARTIGLVLGLPPMNRFDRTGLPLTACFTNKPDIAPFNYRPAKIALDEMNPSPKALNGEAKRWAVASQKLDLHDVDRVDPNIVGRAVWHSVRGSAAFPSASFNPPEEPDDDD